MASSMPTVDGHQRFICLKMTADHDILVKTVVSPSLLVNSIVRIYANFGQRGFRHMPFDTATHIDENRFLAVKAADGDRAFAACDQVVSPDMGRLS